MAKATHTLFITPQYLKDNSALDNNIDEKILNKCIRVASDKYIMVLIGSPLYDALITKIDDLSIAGDYKTLLDDYVTPCLLEYAVYEFIPKTYKFKNTGLSKQSTPNSEPVNEKEILIVKEDVLDTAEFYGQRLKNYLDANINLYPEYLQYRNVSDVPPSNQAYFSGIMFPDSGTRNSDLGKGYTTDL